MDFWAILYFSLKFSRYFSAKFDSFFVYCTVSWTFLLVFSHWQRSFCHYNHESEFCPKPRHLGHFVGGGMGLGGLLTVGGSWQSGEEGVVQNRVSPDLRSPEVIISKMAGCWPLSFLAFLLTSINMPKRTWQKSSHFDLIQLKKSNCEQWRGKILTN